MTQIIALVAAVSAVVTASVNAAELRQHVINRLREDQEQQWFSAGKDGKCGPLTSCTYGKQWCDGVVSGTCTDPQPLGWGPCTKDYQCESGICAMIGGGFKCSNANGAGAKCADDNECLSGICSIIAGGGKCIDKQPAGETCTVDRECASDICSIIVSGGKCIDKRAVGESCAKDRECATDICSVLVNGGKCIDKRVAGDKCGGDVECASGICSFANGMACIDPLVGGTCSEDRECATGNYCIFLTCRAKAAAGDNCVSNSDCESGDCQWGIPQKCA